MANGHDPDCVTCANFEHHGVPNVRDPSSQNGCRLHRVKLPLALTDQLLICRDWESASTSDRLVNWRTQGRYKPGVLYAYPNMYTPTVTEFRVLSELPPLE